MARGEGFCSAENRDRDGVVTGAPAPRAVAPLPHDGPREARRRVMIGLGGLLLMLLLVLLAGFLTGQYRQEAEVAKAQAEAAGVSNPGGGAAPLPSPTEPLGDVAADPDAAPLVIAPVVPDSDGTITVPDLQPDPQLEAAKNQ